MPVFLATERLKPFIDEDLEAMALNPVQYQKEGKFYTGYPAEMLPKVCNAWLMAREAHAGHATSNEIGGLGVLVWGASF